MDASQVLDPRKTIFVGGVPRPLRAVELALIMDRLYGGVCYAGIDVDPELKYPKGMFHGWTPVLRAFERKNRKKGGVRSHFFFNIF